MMDIKEKDEHVNSLMNNIDTVRAIIECHDVIKLHLGCGTIYKNGWINIDNNSDSNIAKLDLNLDLRAALPFPDNRVDFIFNEHFLEHLSPADAVCLLKDCRRTLKPGGVLRVAMPDLADCVEAYISPGWLQKNRDILQKGGIDFIQTPAEFMNIAFRWWGHQWLYDWEELRRRLQEAGFTQIVRCANGESVHLELQHLEVRETSTLVAEATK